MKRREFIQQSGLLAGGITATAALQAHNILSNGYPVPKKPYKVDTHMHLWDPKLFPYSWLQNDTLLNRRYGIKEYQTATQDAQIGKMVFVECGVDAGNNLKEVEWVVKQIDKDPRISGIVAKSNLSQKGSLEEEWEILQDNKWVKGIRSGADTERLMDKKYTRRLRKLSEYDLSFDLHINSSTYDAADQAIRIGKNTQFILNHIGIPDIKGGEWESWQQGIVRLSKLPNLICKISGVITRAGEGWTTEMIRPYIYHVIESFGFDRIIYGGDWPVVLKAGSYQSWASAFEQLTHEFSTNELIQLYHSNAERIYRL